MKFSMQFITKMGNWFNYLYNYLLTNLQCVLNTKLSCSVSGKTTKIKNNIRNCKLKRNSSLLWFEAIL